MEDMIFLNGFKNRTTQTSPHEHSLPAIVSIEVQTLGETYDVETGFRCGTSFPELNKPFLAGGM